jgi:hypothetical protein
MSNRFGKEMVEAVEEMAAHMRDEIEVESYEVEFNPEERPSDGTVPAPRSLDPSKRMKKT